MGTNNEAFDHGEELGEFYSTLADLGSQQQQQQHKHQSKGSDEQLRDDLSHAETMSRRRFEPHQALSAPVLTKNAEGVISIDMDTRYDDSGFYVRWSNLSYTVSSKWYQSPWNKTSKTILNNLNGFFLSGELIALMGPSGK